MRSVEITYRYASGGVPPSPRPADAVAALRRLESGNEAFALLIGRLASDEGAARRVIEVDARDLGLLAGKGLPRQQPFAVVLGCSDARVPVELIFNEGPNDLFVVRVAGNGLGADVAGSLRYAIEHLGESLKLVVVMGHSGCGAVTSAVDVYLRPAGYLSLASNAAVRSLLDRLHVVVHASAGRMSAVFGADVVQRPGYRGALIETCVLVNAALAAYTIQQEIGVGAPDRPRVAYGVYLIDSRAVWAPRVEGGQERGLAFPPEDAAGFVALADALLRTRRIGSLLDAEPA